VSLKPTPVSEELEPGLVTVNESVVPPLRRIVTAPNDLERTGGDANAVLVRENMPGIPAVVAVT
jgi:hypothetical protein